MWGLGMMLLLVGCTTPVEEAVYSTPVYLKQVLEKEEEQNEMNKDLGHLFEGIPLQETLKRVGYNNPVMTQRFGADPYAMVYEGRVYLYMTGDIFEYDAAKQIKTNTYATIHTINVLSSDDLVNWTDHGSVYAAGYKGACKWGNNAWAPAAAYKEIDGKMQFFLYFANGGGGIGVLSADSPVGPFTDPLKGPLGDWERVFFSY